MFPSCGFLEMVGRLKKGEFEKFVWNFVWNFVWKNESSKHQKRRGEIGEENVAMMMKSMK